MQHRWQEFPLWQLMRDVHVGSLALPEFQRDFVWDPERVIELLDSVSRGWPIGSLLVLEGPQPFGVKSIEDGPRVDSIKVDRYLLDGQQRVTALYHALLGRGEYAYYVDLEDHLDADLPEFRWIGKDRYQAKNQGKYRFLLPEILDEVYFSGEIAHLSSKSARRLIDARNDRLGYLLGMGYILPAIVMDRGIQLEALARIFETLNRTGVQLDAFDLMVAVLYPAGFKLREKWDVALDAHPILEDMGAGAIEVLKVIALWQRDADRLNKGKSARHKVNGVRQSDVLNIPAVAVSRYWDRAINSYVGALRFLRNEAGVRDRSSVPSVAMILVLAYALAADLSIDKIKSWYWQAIATQSYAQGANTQVISDIDLRLPLRDKSAVLQIMHAALGESSRRNRILRLGLRGLAARGQVLDIHSGVPIKGPIREFSLSTFLSHGRLIGASEDPLVTLAFCDSSSLRGLRQWRPGDSLRVPPINSAALHSQGFKGLWEAVEGNDLSERKYAMLSWMEKRL